MSKLTPVKHVEHDTSLKGYYAGFVSRLIAFVIDAAIVTLALVILGWTTSTILSFFNLNPTDVDLTAPNVTLNDYIRDAIAIIIVFAIPVVSVSIWVGYYIGSWVLLGQTIGKQLLGLKIISVDNKRISIRQAIVRYIGYWISAMPLFAGYWWVLLDDDRRAWHDHLSKTCVIYVWDARKGTQLQDLLAQVLEDRERDKQQAS